MGIKLNMHYIHQKLGKQSLQAQGFDPLRAKAGVVKENVNAADIESLHNHYLGMSSGNESLFPPLQPGR
jgi:hypothetical protein